MSVHYFHCTDGISLFADEEGSPVRGDEVFLAAMQRAEKVMRGLPSHDWSDWLVCVYDDLRQMVDVVDFPRLRPLAAGRDQGIGEGAVRAICAARRGSPVEAALKPRP